MRLEKIMYLSRKDIIELLEKEFKVKFKYTALSSTGFKGGY